MNISLPPSAPLGHRIAFTTEGPKGSLPALALKTPNGWIALQNRCRHWAEELDTVDGNILDTERNQIVCSIHGARFEIRDGLCTSGPCQGAALHLFAVREENGILHVDVDPPF